MQKIVFIMGAHRSGTTMVRNVLDNSSEISTTPELHYFNKIRSSVFFKFSLHKTAKNAIKYFGNHIEKNRSFSERKEFERKIKNAKSEREIILNLTKYTGSKKEANILIEKTPVNVFYIKELERIFPEAKFVFLIRDGREVCASAFKKWKNKGTKYLSVASRWVETIKNIDKTIKNENVVLFYEKLTDNSEDEFKKLFDFIGVSFDDSYLEKVKSTSSFSELKGTQGIKTSRHYKDFFTKKERKIIESVLGKYRDPSKNCV